MNGLMGQVFHGNSHRREELKRSSVAIFTCIVNFADVPEVDQTLGAGGAWHVGDKDQLFNKTWAIAVDHSVFFGVETAAVAWLIPVAAIGKTCGVTVITHGQHLTKIRAGHDSPDMQTFAGGTPRQAESQIHINFFKIWTHHRNPRSNL